MRKGLKLKATIDLNQQGYTRENIINIQHQIHQQEIEIAREKQNWTITWIRRKSNDNVTIKSNNKKLLTMRACKIQDKKWKWNLNVKS